MIKAVSLLRSGTLHGLLVALVAYALGMLGLAEQFPDSQVVVENLLKALEAGGMFYAAFRRTFFPNPPLTAAAEGRTTALVEKGKLEVRT